MLLCKSKKRLSDTEDVAKKDAFESLSHSFLICRSEFSCSLPGSDPAQLGDPLGWGVTELRPGGHSFLPGCVRSLPWASPCSALPPWKREDALVQSIS